MNGWGWFFLILFLILIVYAAWAGWHFYNAKRQGLPPPPMKSYIPFMGGASSNTNYPTPRSSGPLEWIKDKVDRLRNKRTAAGAYEGAGGAEQGYRGVGATGGRRGRGVEDDAWDTRVGNEDPYGSGPGGYYEEQELGLAPTPGYAQEAYGTRTDYMSQSTTYGGGSHDDRGRPQSSRDNPFGDQNEAASLRDVSPRPQIDTRSTARTHKKDNMSLDSAGSSPTSTRKSIFREGI